MKEPLNSIPTQETFVHDGKNYVILRREGNMTEVVDEAGKRWVWPNESQVTHAINEAFKYPVRKVS